MIKREVEILKTKIVYSDFVKSLQRERTQVLSVCFVPSVEGSLALADADHVTAVFQNGIKVK